MQMFLASCAATPTLCNSRWLKNKEAKAEKQVGVATARSAFNCTGFTFKAFHYRNCHYHYDQHTIAKTATPTPTQLQTQ